MYENAATKEQVVPESIARRACPVCGKQSAPEAFRSYRGAVCCCARCGVYFVIEDAETPAGQEKLFYSTLDEQRYKEYFQPFRTAQYREVLGQLALKPGVSSLDVGASYGWMVQAGLDLGFDSYGIEPGDARCDPHLEGRLFRTSLTNYAAQADRTFDLITIWHVLEHLPDPATAVRQMSDLLAPGGILLVAVPSSEGRIFKVAMLLLKVFGSKSLLNELFYFHNPNMHFTYPNTQSVRLLLDQASLKTLSAELMESLDWKRIWKRAKSPLMRWGLRAGGPFVAWSGFTGRENLVVIAQKPSNTE